MINNKPVFLGLRLCDHDSNISLSIGNKVKYRKTERHIQRKHHGYDNLWEWIFVLKEWDVNISDIDAVAIVIDGDYWGCVLECDHSAPYELLKTDWPLFNQLSCPVFRVDHHYAHSMSTWPLGLKSTTDFVIDTLGDGDKNHSIFKNKSIYYTSKRSDHSDFGTALQSVGEFVGMKGNSLDFPGKLMGRQAYGHLDSNFYNRIKNNAASISDLKEELFIYDWFKYKGTENLEESNWVDWLKTVHTLLEVLVPEYFLEHCNKNETISYTGGAAQNTVINTKIKEHIPNLVIPPHCPDDGLSLGCIEVLRQIHQEEPFDTSNFPYWQDDVAPDTHPSKQTIKETAEKLANGKIVGWYQGNGEIGPRALGNRSVLMNPMVKDGKNIINEKVKFREPYRPFGASILHEKTNEYFEWNEPSPYMLYVQNIRNKTDFQSITHVDGTCRIQTVQNENPLYRELLEEFEKLTGVPMLLNTSLNVGGKPIAGKPRDAWEIFFNTEIYSVVIGGDVLNK